MAGPDFSLPYMEVFSDVMKRRMRELHLKQRELAKMLGVCPSYI